MNREILFRGIRVDNGEWMHGCYLKERACDGIQHIIVDDDGDYYQINPKTRGQYTGLTDRNGRKIFEGDIVNRKGTFYEVKYSTELTSFLAFSSNGFFNPVVFQNCEVIGNVHDNPELLKGEENA